MKTKQFFRFVPWLLLGFLTLPLGCNDDTTAELTELPLAAEFTAEVPQEWLGLTLELIKTTPGFSPPVAARALGYLGVTAYESVVGGIPNHQSLAGQLSDLKAPDLPKPLAGEAYFWPLAANAALAEVTDRLFFNASASDKFKIAALRDQFDNFYRNQIDFDVRERSVNFGRLLGQAIVSWAATDPVGHEAQMKNFPSDYVLPKGEEKWVPTGAQAIPLQPRWGNARTFVPNCAALTQPVPPFAFSTAPNSRFYGQALEVYTVSKEILEEEKVIAAYWADGGGTVTPPGHSMAIAIQLSKAQQQNLAQAAMLFARLGMAVNDAFVSCWRCKYQFNLLRPETYIQKYIDPTWKPFIATPPFPEYTSGHSTQSGAMAVILSETFGYNFPFTDNTHQGRTDINGRPRAFANFIEAGTEAMNSRLYGGIHYRMGNERGLNQGMAVGKEIMELRFER